MAESTIPRSSRRLRFSCTRAERGSELVRGVTRASTTCGCRSGIASITTWRARNTWPSRSGSIQLRSTGNRRFSSPMKNGSTRKKSGKRQASWLRRRREGFALVGTADMVFTPDTSISHAASAFRKPSLVLLKREHKPYAPWNTPGEIIAWNEDQIYQLPHERVRDALDRLLVAYGG